LLVAGAFVVIVLIAGSVRLVRRRARVEPSVALKTPPPSPVEDALAQARRWRMEGDTARYYGCLERIVGEDLAKRFSCRKPKVTSANDLPSDVDRETRRRVESFFSRCAEAKYAPGTPPREELDRIWEDANHLLSGSDSPL
ncbi:MAG: hypothetical protein ABIH23_22980, partial [bacterium]